MSSGGDDFCHLIIYSPANGYPDRVRWWSDFLALLKLWDYYHEQAHTLSKNKRRERCRTEFLSYMRLRKWHELRQKLHGLVTVSLAALNQLDPKRLDWLVPGLLGQRLTALLKALPKSLRRHFVPVPAYVQVLLNTLTPDRQSLTEAMAEQLAKVTGVSVPANAWRLDEVPEHLRMRIRVLDADGQVLVE